MSEASASRPGAASRLALHAVETYRLRVSGRLDTRCPFTPTCSEYALESYRRLPFATATYRTVRRLLRCRPGYRGSLIDPP